MANDRLMLECKGCGETFTLLKFWGGGDFAFPAPTSVEGQRNARESLADWMTRHAKECASLFGGDLDEMGDRIRLVTEKTQAR